MSEQANKIAEREAKQPAAPLDETPHSPEAEQSLLGAIMLDGAVMDKVANLVAEDDFFIDAHRVIYRACLQLAMQGQPVDEVTVYERIESEGRATRAGAFSYVASLSKQTPSAANAQKYADIIREKSVRRKAIAKGHELIAAAGSRDGRSVSDVIQEGESAMMELADMTNRDKQDFKDGRDVLIEVVERMDHLYNNPPENGIVGIATGYSDFDKLTSGLQPGLYILAGRPAMGKTALAMNMAENIALNDLPVAVFSMEMPANQLMQRMMGSVGKIDQSRMRNVSFTDEDWSQVTYAVGKLNQAEIHICDTPSLSTMDIRSRSRKLTKRVGKLGLIVVDYLQLMASAAASSRNANRAEIVGEFSRSLKILSGELEAPVLALSQLNRSVEQRPNKRPGMADLRESGSLEQDADAVMFVYRDEVYNPDSPDRGIAELIIGKNRHGPIDVIRLAFRGQYTRFENMAQYSSTNGYAE